MINKGLGSRPPERVMILDNLLLGAMIVTVLFFIVCGFWKITELVIRVFN